MVKRQTVWLSTMMVLSLMLIGYYTMNNQTSTTSTNPSNSTTPTVTTSPTNQTQLSNQSQETTGSNVSSADNWYNALQASVNNEISQRISNDQAIIANNNASQAQIAEAQKQLGEEEALYNSLQQATQAVIAEGYKNAVIAPDKNQTTFTVYVETNHLSKADAVKIMNIVSQQLDTSIFNISVKPHA
ncbi:SpoIIIAH-like family protein [Alicyclobacillus vulcanalis]|uniref:Stage III sporulation protein AH n=1 Tax=Alicyclobacillus vulcanalis TaxID=252246 RepID=A0A1N7KNJ5_9BACL|nr:SpoIIIAH-like family protein [Alicyclobacillus vulcanalis]SIS63137.1 stage III sporulation protein AH [Alicyclobacillus vulcanalis]